MLIYMPMFLFPCWSPLWLISLFGLHACRSSALLTCILQYMYGIDTAIELAGYRKPVVPMFAYMTCKS